ncbi:PPE family protein [Mycobacterium heckeshornense]|uniref:PPE family protein n=1 Tax=Mycobacterium heckeshornense TaxID=110505 RepID=UPI0011566BF8|nr:PPE family protein [Mycobacterium heckeshornense]MCV7036234.1 PPE family protein [Mycobacterium heckeshornense]
MDFGLLPPEINSGRMYSGPGPGSMLEAAVAWDRLAVELRSAAASYSAAIAGLTSVSWLGEASASMAAAAAPYVTWLDTTAGQAEESAAHAKAAVAAYEAALAATVPPPVIAANRAQLQALAATNFFGQNSPAIAATEAQYGEMWAQDAAAMYGYAGASSAASAVTPFSPPPTTTHPAGSAAQATAVIKAAGTLASTATAQSPSALSVPQVLQHLSSAASASTTTSSLLGGLNPGQGAWGLGLTTSNLTTILKQSFGITPYFYTGLGSFGMGIAQQLTSGPGGTTAGVGGAWYPTPQFAGLGGLGNWGGPGSVSASAGRAGTVGRLTVPPSWATATPQPESFLASGWSNTHIHPGVPASGVLRGIPLTAAGLGQRAAGGFVHRYGFRHSVMPRPPAAG